MLPLDMEVTNAGVLKWLKDRFLPTHRMNADKILKTLWINGLQGIINQSMGLSLNDCYWIVPENFEGKFSDYNLYENSFSQMLSEVAFSGSSQIHETFTISPE